MPHNTPSINLSLEAVEPLYFVDPHSEADRGVPTPNSPFGGSGPKNSDLGKLFDAWGVELTKGKVVGDLPLAKKVQIQQESRLRSWDYPIWIGLTKGQLNDKDIVTAQIQNVNLASAGILKKKGDASTEFLPLFQSDEAAMQIEASQLAFMPDVASLLKNYRPKGRNLPWRRGLPARSNRLFQMGSPQWRKVMMNPVMRKKKRIPRQKSISLSQKNPLTSLCLQTPISCKIGFGFRFRTFLDSELGIPNAGQWKFGDQCPGQFGWK